MSDTNIVKIKFGSTLYGTADEQSDIDNKIIFLPNIDNLLLGKVPRNFVKKDSAPNSKMNAGEEEIEYIPLQRFAIDFFEGQSYAYELAFALEKSDNYEFLADVQCSTFFYFLDELKSIFLTKDISHMVGYAIHQSQVYGVKGERLNAVEKLLNFLKTVEKPKTTKLKDIVIPLDCVNAYVRYAYIKGSNTEYANQLALQVNNRYYHVSEKIQNLITNFEKLFDKYGHRAKKAQENEVDWKALSHAIRIVFQANEILTKEHLTFPLEIADVLRDVKRGRVEFDDAVSLFSELNNSMDRNLLTSELPPKTDALKEEFNEWLCYWLKVFYEIEI